MTDIMLALACLVLVPVCLLVVGELVLEQIRLLRAERAKETEKLKRAKRLRLLDKELQELEEEENRRF